MTRALSCIIGCLAITHHNEIGDKLFYLYWRSVTSASVRSEPLTNQGRTSSEKFIRQGSDKNKETQGYVMIRGLWDSQVDATIDVKLGDADADMYN